MDDAAILAGFPSHSIAIVGLAGRFPGADGLEGFWRNIRNGVESLDTLDAADLDAAAVPQVIRSHPAFVANATVLERAEYFDAGFFGISPREAEIMDPQHRVFLECAWEAMEHAGHAAGAGVETVGVYAGVTMNTYLFSQVLKSPSLVEAAGAYQLMLGNDKDFLCTRVSYKLDLRGPSMTIQTACSTSLVAVEAACRALQHGECDMALAGGVSIAFPQRAGYVYQEGMILSPDGHCRPFDADAKGTRPGAGAGIVVLRRLEDALADGDTVHAVIRGAAINNDGAGKAGFTAPSVDGQVEVIAMAQALAQVDPRSIGYVEAHGTGTPLGDPIEIAALTQVFRASTPDVGFCRLGSLKANLGHLDAAAGVAGLIKAVLVLQHRELPPLVNFRLANPQLDLDRTPFAASPRAAAWEAAAGVPRRAGVSSFGIGGTNAHVVLEEAPSWPASTPARKAHLLLLSAKTPTALERATSELADHLEAREDQPLADVEWTLQVGRRGFGHRRIVVARTHAEAVKALRQPQRPPVFTATHAGGERPVAFLFSGQGSQHAGMGRNLYEGEPVYRDAVDRCAQLLQPHLGSDIRETIFADAGSPAINETRLTQPALFATEYALASLWMAWGVKPHAMMGHSIGEYVAAHLAGVLSLEDALRVVAARGSLMQALPEGSMAAVHLGEAEVARWLGQGVELAAVNAPGLCTVSGPKGAVADLLLRLESAGVEARPLHTSHAFHSTMMEPALVPFAAVLDGVALAPPAIPYVSNLTGTWITPEQATSPGYYAAHLRQAVQFEAGVRTLSGNRALFLLEVGPGNALTSLARLTLGKDGAGQVIQSLPHAREQRSETDTILEAAGRLWLAGTPIVWPAVHAGGKARRVPLPTYPFERKRYWAEAPAAGVGLGSTRPVDGAPVPARRKLDEWFFAPTWTREDSRPNQQHRLHGPWLVLGDDEQLTQNLVAGLRSAGATPIVVERGAAFEHLGTRRFRVRSDSAEDYAAVASEVKRLAGGAVSDAEIHGIVSLWDLNQSPSAGDREATVYDELVAIGCGVAASIRAVPIRVVHATVGAVSVLDEPVKNFDAALALGPTLVLPTEFPGLTIRVLDLELHDDELDLDDALTAMLEEAVLHDGEASVARRAHRRWVRRYERVALSSVDSGDVPLRKNGRYVITGGLGGMGLALGRWLAQSVQARLLLTARSPLPPREEWDDWLQHHSPEERHAAAITAIREIESAGGEVMIGIADAADDVAMEGVVEAARAKWGGFDGIVHAAGIAGSGQIVLRQRSGDAQAVLAPKVQGIRVLTRLLSEDLLDFVAMMSSINTVFGAPGACGYTSANAVLDAFAESAAYPANWRNVVSIAWGAWRDVGMAANLVVPEARREEWNAHLESSIPTSAGVEAFARVLASGRRRIVVLPHDLPALDEQVRARNRAAIMSATSLTDVTQEDVAHADEVPVSGLGRSGAGHSTGTPVECRLAAIWTELLGVDDVGLDDDFFELGGHSLLATRVLARVDETLGVRLSLRDVFDTPTVRGLAERVVAGMAPANPVTDEDREEIEF